MPSGGLFWCPAKSNLKLKHCQKSGGRAIFAVPKRLGTRNPAGRTREYLPDLPLPASHGAAQTRQGLSTCPRDLDRANALPALPCPSKRRLADEYDAAQAAGQVATPRDGNLGRSNGERPATAKEVGLTRKEVHDARQLRDAEARDPGKGSGLGPFHPARTPRTLAIAANAVAHSIVRERRKSAIVGDADCKNSQAKGG